MSSQSTSDFKVAFSTNDVVGNQQFEYWVDKIEAFFDIDKNDFKRASNFTGSLELLQCSDVIFGECRAQEQLYFRDQKRLMSDGLDHFILQVFLKGGGPVENGPEIEAGDIIVIDMGRLHARDSWPHHTLSFVIPRDKDVNLTKLLERMHNQKLPKAHPLTRMLFSQMRQLWELQQEMTVLQMQTALDSTLEFFKTNLSVQSNDLVEHETPLSSAALAQSIRTYIEGNLGQELTPDRISQRFRISRSQLYRLFNEDGGLMRYVQQRRLVRSSRLLRTARDDESIISVAAQVGFKSDSHFSRSFKSWFGMTPSEARNSLQVNAAALGENRQLIDSWLNDLSVAHGK